MAQVLAMLLASGQGWAALMLAITVLLVVMLPVVIVFGIAGIVVGIRRR